MCIVPVVFVVMLFFLYDGDGVTGKVYDIYNFPMEVETITVLVLYCHYVL